LKKWIFHHTQVELPSVLDAYQKKVEEEEIPYTRKVKLLMALCKAGKLTVDNATVLPGTTLATLPAEGGANRGGGEDEDENNDDNKKPKKLTNFEKGGEGRRNIQQLRWTKHPSSLIRGI